MLITPGPTDRLTTILADSTSLARSSLGRGASSAAREVGNKILAFCLLSLLQLLLLPPTFCEAGLLITTY
eukprot:COSAG04_NODE_19817_length_407_cov_1.146104_1_plen_70_part_00